MISDSKTQWNLTADADVYQKNRQEGRNCSADVNARCLTSLMTPFTGMGARTG